MKAVMFVYLYETYKTVVTGYDFIKYVECGTLGYVHIHKKYPPSPPKKIPCLIMGEKLLSHSSHANYMIIVTLE